VERAPRAAGEGRMVGCLVKLGKGREGVRWGKKAKGSDS
jgi:hypothetical protein